MVPTKEPVNFLGQTNLTKSKMMQMIIKTLETDSTIEATERVVKIIDNIYDKYDLEQV